MSATVNIGHVIARERRRKHITQETLAAHLGVSKAAVSKWELGQSLPDVSLLPRIAAYFSLTLDELFDWRGTLSDEESATLYAEVYALAEKDLPDAHERLRAVVAQHYSDANLLLMMASLLTMWAARATATSESDDKNDDAATTPPSPEALTEEALELTDRVFEVAEKPEVVFLAQQQKATVLFQTGRYAQAAALLEPLVRRPDANAAVALLASAYRELGRTEDAIRLLQAERLRAANFVLSSLVQETGLRQDAAFTQAASAAGMAVHTSLDMDVINPWHPVAMAIEASDAQPLGENKDVLPESLAHAIEAATSASASLPDAASSPLWDHLLSLLDPAQAGEAWARHKAHQADELRELVQQVLAEQAEPSE